MRAAVTTRRRIGGVLSFDNKDDGGGGELELKLDLARLIARAAGQYACGGLGALLRDRVLVWTIGRACSGWKECSSFRRAKVLLFGLGDGFAGACQAYFFPRINSPVPQPRRL